MLSLSITMIHIEVCLHFYTSIYKCTCSPRNQRLILPTSASSILDASGIGNASCAEQTRKSLSHTCNAEVWTRRNYSGIQSWFAGSHGRVNTYTDTWQEEDERRDLRVNGGHHSTHRQEGMHLHRAHDTERLLIFLDIHIYMYIFTHTYNMRHTRCTDRSINTVDVDSFSDTEGEMGIEQSSGVYDIQTAQSLVGTNL